MSYAVIDLETTGFSPARGDRIIEVGIVLLDDDGTVEREWATLINPQRDVGPTHVHGIRAGDVIDAPLFSDVAAHLVSLLSGRTLAAHNQEFDLRFLKAELAAHGFVLPSTYVGLCTMLWSRSAFGASKLSDVCATLEIEHASAHAALGDARATAQVVAVLLRAAGHSPQWEADSTKAIFPLSAYGSATVPRTQRASVVAAPMAFVDTAELPLWERVSIPVDASDAASVVYLDMLSRVLEDGLMSAGEFSRLDAIIEVAHLSSERIVMLHASYLAAAYLEALADGHVSESERRELAQIATILDLPIPEVPDAAMPAQKSRSAVSVAPAATGSVFTLAPGARVVFTGALSRPRESWASALADAGFITGSVTKNCAVLIAEDPASQSGKAKTARAHGIPIVTEAEFIPVFDAYVAERATVV